MTYQDPDEPPRQPTYPDPAMTYPDADDPMRRAEDPMRRTYADPARRSGCSSYRLIAWSARSTGRRQRSAQASKRAAGIFAAWA